MTERNDDLRLPSKDRPLNGPRRTSFGPMMATLLLLAVVAGIFFVIFLLR